MHKPWAESFREKLNQHYRWPALYVFKFIVPAGKESEAKALFPLIIPNEKPSSAGKYTSLTFQVEMPHASAVISVYEKASQIEGLIAL